MKHSPQGLVSRLRPHRTPIVLAAILCLGLYLRFELTQWSLPYMHHWDEPAVASRSIEMLQAGDLNPHFFNYGTLPIYMAAAVDAVVLMKLAGRPADDPESAISLGDISTRGYDGWPWEISHPEFLRWNRRWTSTIGVATILLIFFFGRELGRGSFDKEELARGDTPGEAPVSERSPGQVRGNLVGLTAAAWLAVLFYHVEHSAIVTVDIPVSFFALSSLWASWLAWRDQQPSRLFLAAGCVGLAIACKYNSALYLLTPLAVALVGMVRRPAIFRPWLLPAVGITAVATFFVAMPYALLDPREFLDDAAYEIHHYMVFGSGDILDAEPGFPHLMNDLGKLATNLGLGGTLLAALGLFLALRRPQGWIFFSLPLVQLYFTSLTLPDFHRNVLILYPMASVALGLSVVELTTLGLARTPPRFRRAVLIGVPALLLVWLGFRLHDTLGRIEWLTKPDTRTLAVDRLEIELETGDRKLGVASELHLHSLDLGRLPESTVRRPTYDLICDPKDEDLLLVASQFEGKDDSLSERLTRLVASLGSPMWSEGGSPWGALQLDRYTVRPEVVLLPAPSEPLVMCAEEGIAHHRLKISGPSAVYSKSLGLPPGSSATTPAYTFPPGLARYAISLASPDGTATSLVDLRVWQSCGGDCREERHSQRLTLDSGGTTEVIDLPLDRAEALSFEVSVADESASGILIRGQWASNK